MTKLDQRKNQEGRRSNDCMYGRRTNDIPEYNQAMAGGEAEIAAVVGIIATIVIAIIIWVTS